MLGFTTGAVDLFERVLRKLRVLGVRAYDCKGPEAVDVFERVDDELQDAEEDAAVASPVTVHDLVQGLRLRVLDATVTPPITVEYLIVLRFWAFVGIWGLLFALEGAQTSPVNNTTSQRQPPGPSPQP